MPASSNPPERRLPGLAPLLARVRRRLRARELLRGSLLWAAATAGSGLALVTAAALVGPSVIWLPLGTAWLVGTLSALGLIGMRAFGQQRSDEAVARYIGERVPDLRSDLLSAVQLADDPASSPANDVGGVTRALIDELCRRTAAAAGTLSAEQLVDMRPVRQAAAIAAAVLCGVILWTRLAPLSLLGGWRHVTSLPQQQPVQVSAEPLLGDVRLLLTYPAYTGLSPRSIPSSSGDVVALPGTQVRLEARALGRLDRAQLVLSMRPAGSASAASAASPGSPGTAPGAGKEPVEKTQPVQILRERHDHSRGAESPPHPLLATGFTISGPGHYYFIIERGPRDVVRESGGHRIDIEVDNPPRIDLFASADELEVTGMRRIELAYSAEDDLGLGDIDLVYRVDKSPERRKRLRSAGEARKPEAAATGASKPHAAPLRTIAAKIEWELAELELPPGSRVTYFVEARDLDSVSGPNVGRSREYALRILSPRDRQEALLSSQEQLRDLAVHLLGDRIELQRALAGHPSELPPSLQEQALGAHRKTEAFLLQVGRVQQEGARSSGNKDLLGALQEIGRRLGKLTQDEEVVLGELRKGRERRGRGIKDKDIAQHNDRHVGEVERDTLLLDDLIGQKRLEELLAISDEMSQLRDRMKQMLAEYGKHPSEALRKELERELRAFERRMAELIDKARAMQGELPDEFMNREALGQSDLQSRLDRLRDLINKGDVHKAQEELNRMSQALDGLVKGLEHGLRGFRRERFSAEEKALSELEGKLADLVHDQEELRQRTDSVRQSAAARTRQVLRDRVEALSKRLSADIQKLRKTLEGVDVAPLGPWGTDEMDKVHKRLDDLQRMVEQGDLDEAKAMASEAEQSLGRLEEEVRGEEQASRWGLKVRLSRSRAKLEQARPQARDIVNEIARALLRPEEVLSPAERQQLSELRAQEEALRKRVGELGRELNKRARDSKDAPRLEQLAQEAPEGLRKATSFMEQSEGELKRLQPRGASSAQGQALEQLGQLRRGMQEARRPRNEGAGMRSEREPVKIPGVDEYRAPKEFRQDLLDAAKREAPSEYREQVRRYYEELIR
jgi:soluble cytochrome b562